MKGRALGWRGTGLAVMALALTGCSGPAPKTYDLSAPLSGIAGRQSRGQLVVTEPVATQALDAERILIRPKRDEVAYLSGAQWADRLPKLVQTRLIQTFENARLLTHVGRPGERLSADLTLDSEIRSFEIDVERGEAVVEISVKLVNDRSGRIVSGQIFRAHVAGSASSGEGASAALDTALAQVMRAIVQWASGRV